MQCNAMLLEAVGILVLLTKDNTAIEIKIIKLLSHTLTSN